MNGIGGTMQGRAGRGGKERKGAGREGAGRMGELELIERIRRGATTRNAGVRLGIGDDGAVLRLRAGEEMVVTTDLLLEGRHFRRDWHTPESAGHRCLARGLSDVAATGGRPVAAFLSLGLPADFKLRWLDRFMTGFGALAAVHGVELAGGDTAEVAGEEMVADIVVVGAVPSGRALRRGTARVGDLIYVTGMLGGAAVELEALAGGAACARRAGAGAEGRRQTFPEPRVGVGRGLVRREIASAAMDLSDGLSSDLAKLCEASGVGAEVETARLPLAPGATLEQGLHGGEDYELLFTGPAGVRVPGRISGVRVTQIGRMVRRRGVRLVGVDGQQVGLEAGGWEHFGVVVS